MTIHQGTSAQSDPLFPASTLLPLSEAGGFTPLNHIPGMVRPLAASLGIIPLIQKNVVTAATRNTEVKQTQYTVDGRTETDAVPIVVTD